MTFRYKHELDPEGIPKFGLVAEQVERVNPDLVARDHQGKVNSVRYEAVNAMLLNEFRKEIKALAASLKALQIPKVSGQREANKPAAQTAAGG